MVADFLTFHSYDSELESSVTSLRIFNCFFLAGAGRSKILVDSSMSLDKYEPFPTNSCITTTTIKTWNSFITLKTSLGSFEISHPTQAPAPGKPWCVCLSLIILFIYFWASLWLRGKEICLPMQGTRVPSLILDDPTCSGAAKPMHLAC